MVYISSTPYGVLPVMQLGMADDAAIRLKNFKDLYAKTGFSPTEVARELGNRPQFWSDLMNGRKSFGEKLARGIEEKKSLVRLSLDDPQGAKQMPLSNDLLAHLAGLPADQREDAESLLRIHLKLPPAGTIRKPTGTSE
jgi:hypothetical protein